MSSSMSMALIPYTTPTTTEEFVRSVVESDQKKRVDVTTDLSGFVFSVNTQLSVERSDLNRWVFAMFSSASAASKALIPYTVPQTSFEFIQTIWTKNRMTYIIPMDCPYRTYSDVPLRSDQLEYDIFMKGSINVLPLLPDVILDAILAEQFKKLNEIVNEIVIKDKKIFQAAENCVSNF